MGRVTGNVYMQTLGKEINTSEGEEIMAFQTNGGNITKHNELVDTIQVLKRLE